MFATSFSPSSLRQLLARVEELKKEHHPPANPDPLDKMFCEGINKTQGYVAPWYHGEL